MGQTGLRPVRRTPSSKNFRNIANRQLLFLHWESELLSSVYIFFRLYLSEWNESNFCYGLYGQQIWFWPISRGRPGGGGSNARHLLYGPARVSMADLKKNGIAVKYTSL